MAQHGERTHLCAWYFGPSKEAGDTARMVRDAGMPVTAVRPAGCDAARLRLARGLLTVFDEQLARATSQRHADIGETLDLLAVEVFRMVLDAPCGCSLPLARRQPVNQAGPPDP